MHLCNEGPLLSICTGEEGRNGHLGGKDLKYTVRQLSVKSAARVNYRCHENIDWEYLMSSGQEFE